MSHQSARIADLLSADGEYYSVRGGEIVRRGARLYRAMRSLPKHTAGHVFQTWILSRGSASSAPGITFVPNRQGTAIVQFTLDATTVSAVSVATLR